MGCPVHPPDNPWGNFLSAATLVLCTLPAAFVSIFAAASASLASLSDARRRALSQSSENARRSALERYVAQGDVIEARWMVARVTGIVTSALLVHQHLAIGSGWVRLVVAAVAAVMSFSFPAEVAKALATRSSERSAPLLIALLWPFEVAAAPFAAAPGYVGQIVRRWIPRIEPSSEEVLEREVGLILKDGERQGSIAPEEAQMLKNVLGFGELTARELMVPRIHVTAISLHTSNEELLTTVVSEEHSRYPVYLERIDNVVGILHVKDLLPFVSDRDRLRTLELETILHKPVLFVSLSQTAASVLREMRQTQQHLAVVIDEFGGMSGVVSLEDLLERIVGDIRDEHDDAEPPIVELGQGRLMVDASVSLIDLSRYLGTALPEDDDFTSLGGLLVTQLGRVPPVGAKVSAYGLDFVVRDADERHVVKVEILRQSTALELLGPLSGRPSPSSERAD